MATNYQTDSVRTRVVRPKKDARGNIFPHFDVYIGDKVDNIYWKLDTSEWNNIVGKKKLGRQEYLLKFCKTAEDIARIHRELGGKTLGCWDADSDNCHGHILCDIADNTSLITDADTDEPVVLFYFYPHHKSVLSNYYTHALALGGNTFFSSFHLYTYLRAWHDDGCSPVKLRAIANCLNTRELNRIKYPINQQHHDDHWWKAVWCLFLATRTKFNQQPTCRLAVEAVFCSERKYLAEKNDNVFFGSGPSARPGSQEKIGQLEGKNILAWVLLFCHVQDETNLAFPGAETEERIGKLDPLSPFAQGLFFTTRCIRQGLERYGYGATTLDKFNADLNRLDLTAAK